MLKQDGCSDSRGCRIIASMCLYKYTLQLPYVLFRHSVVQGA